MSRKKTTKEQHRTNALILRILSIAILILFAIPCLTFSVFTGVIFIIISVFVWILSNNQLKHAKQYASQIKKQTPPPIKIQPIKKQEPQSSTPSEVQKVESTVPKAEILKHVDNTYTSIDNREKLYEQAIINRENKLKEEQEKYKFETHKVTGMKFRIDNLMDFAIKNEEFSYTKKELIDAGYEYERVYQYDFYPNKVELVPEPDNPYDKKAIKVVVDGIHIGYIKAGSCSHIHNLIRENKIVSIKCNVYGGKYKYIGYDDIEDKYYIEKGEIEFGAKLTIKLFKE